ncbi:MAG TPA: cache domain-containing protein [Myxococcota bacterium]|nr:cache domain-containing protein [Myxococcota bacterium]HNH45658.1 cache domain-containing protein [Myxococcota bacterium]
MSDSGTYSPHHLRKTAAQIFGVLGLLIIASAWHSPNGGSTALVVLLPVLVLSSIPLIAATRNAATRRIWHGIVLLAVAIVSMVFIGRLLNQQRTERGELISRGQDRTLSAIQQLDGVLSALHPVAEGVAARVIGETRSLNEFRARESADDEWLRDEIRQKDGRLLAQVGYALEAKASLDGKRHGPNAVGTRGEVTVSDLLDVLDYDFTVSTTASHWYHRAKNEKKGGWSEPPYFDEATHAMLAEYTFPMVLDDGTFVGVSYASMPMDSVTRFIKGLDLGEGGYAFLFSRTGVLASYPNQRDVDGTKTLSDLADQEGEPQLARMAAWLASGDMVVPAPAEIRDPMTGGSAFLLCGRVPSAGWGLCTVTLPTHADQVTWSLVVVVSVVTFLCCLLAFLLDPGHGTLPRLWALSLSMSVIFVVAIGVVWREGEMVFEEDGPVIFADSQVARVVADNHDRLEKLGRTTPIYELPSGVLISEVVPGDGMLQIGGMMWQRVALADLPGAEESSELPEWVGLRLANAASMEQEEVFRKDVGPDRVVGWRFRAEVPDLTVVGWYPVSRRTLRLDLVPPTFADPVLLVPDIGAYDLIVSSAMPGIASTVSLAGWEPRRAFFSFVEHDWPVDFGLGEEGIARRLSSLRYSATFELQLINPMVTYLLPETILFMLMFALLAVTTTNSELAERYGLNASSAISTYATFFFIVVLQHIALRQDLASPRLVYLEWVFIVTYVGLLLLTLNAMLVSADSRNWLIRHDDNLLSRLIFWPLLTGCLFGITVVVFHP